MKIKNLKSHRLKNKYVDIILPNDKKYSYILLDEISGIVADKIIEGSTKDEIVNCIHQSYDVDLETIENDVDKVITLFAEGGFIEDIHNFNEYSIEDKLVENTFNDLNRLYYDNVKPFRVFLELTHNCNLKCKHCYLDDYDSNMLTLDEVKNIIDQLYENDVVELVITGGEIGLHPQLVQIVEYATQRFIVTLLTNGTLFNEDIIKELCKYPIYEVQISIYGMEELHNKFVGTTNNMWAESINSLKLFNKYGNIGIAAVVINGTTFNDVNRMVSYFKLNNLKYFLTPVINNSLSGDSRTHKYRISSEQLQELFDKYSLKIGGNICTAGISRFRVAPDKNIYPCELLEHLCFGNLSEYRFSEILDSNKRQEWIQYFKSYLENEECRYCNKKNLCPVCIGVNFNENGDYNIKNSYSCLIANQQYSILEAKI